MKTEYYGELRKVHESINVINSSVDEAVKQMKENQLLDAVKRVIDLGYLARKEGLLALEEAVEYIENDSIEGYLKQMIILVVDGTDPDMLKGIGLKRYYCSLISDYDALTQLIYLEGALSIQAGENPRIIEETLKVMLPNSVYNNYCYKREKEIEEALKERSENLIESLCSGKKLWNSKDRGYFVMKLADYAICDIKDKELERLLREIDNTNLALSMKGLSGDARRHIFSCMSKRLGEMIAENMEYMGPVRAVDVLEATQDIILVLIRLIDRGEIIDHYEYLEPFYDMFSVDTKEECGKHAKYDELKILMKEYEENIKNIVD